MTLALEAVQPVGRDDMGGNLLKVRMASHKDESVGESGRDISRTKESILEQRQCLSENLFGLHQANGTW